MNNTTCQGIRNLMIPAIAMLSGLTFAPAFAQAPQSMPDLAAARPAILPFSAAEIDAVGKKTGLTDCFWVGTVSKDSFNILVPDTGVVYWISQVSLPEGSTLRLKGDFPYARYLSFASYNNEGLPTDSLNDQLITADKGSTNPFMVGAPRDSSERSYTIEVQPRELKAGTTIDATARQPNTLYVPKEDPKYQIWMRVYVPDQGKDVKGGVALPQPELTLADGSTVRGEALCKKIVIKDGAVRDFVANAKGLKTLMTTPGATSPYHPAQNPPEWRTFFNPKLAVAGFMDHTPFAGIIQQLDTTRVGGFYSTKDNRYMYVYMDNRHGENMVIQGKAPSVPRTLAGNKVMEAADVRYWSFCKNRSMANTAVDDCLYDEQVPQNDQGQYTIVVSKEADRPANARKECGVAWLGWGEAGDGIGNPHGGFITYRQMLASPNYAQGIWATQKPGDERATLAAYYPEMRYEAKKAFEARGCPVK